WAGWVAGETWAEGSVRSSQREVMPCIWGVVLVVVARLRAAAVFRLSCWASPSAATSEPVSIDIDYSSPNKNRCTNSTVSSSDSIICGDPAYTTHGDDYMALRPLPDRVNRGWRLVEPADPPGDRRPRGGELFTQTSSCI